MNIKKQVAQIVRKYGTRNPLELAERIGCIVIRCELTDVRGFYQYFQRNHIIYVDSRLPRHTMLFVIAHELGHVFLHKNMNAIFMDSMTYFVKNKYEKEADLFAMNLLLSDKDIENCIDCTAQQIALIFGYEQNLIELRLKDFILNRSAK